VTSGIIDLRWAAEIVATGATTPQRDARLYRVKRRRQKQQQREADRMDRMEGMTAKPLTFCCYPVDPVCFAVAVVVSASAVA
jgi:hypothetical protein